MILEFKDEQLPILEKALSQMPYGVVVGLINDISAQIAKQNEAKDKKEPPKK